MPLETQLAVSWPPQAREGITTLVALSGGPDSMALLRALAATQPFGGRVVVAHFNHRLRGAESDADEAFVRQTASQLALPVSVRRSTHEPSARESRIEESARTERYAFFQQAADKFGARYLATAHTADDQVETVLHRIVRGTGIAGLSGIPRVRRLTAACTLIRPLLFATRADVLEYLRQIGQPFRVDATNQLLDATRNRIRHELLPTLEQYNPRVRESLASLATLASEAQSVIDQLIDDLRQRCAPQRTPAGIELPTATLGGEPIYLVRELLVQLWREQAWPEQSMGYRQWQALANLALDSSPEPRKQVFPGNITCTRTDDTLRLEGPAHDKSR